MHQLQRYQHAGSHLHFLLHTNRNHLDWVNWIIVLGTHLGDFRHESNIFDSSKDGMGTGTATIKPIQKGIVCHVNEKLRPSTLRLTGIGHTKCSGLIGNALVDLSHFIGNPAIMSASVLLSIARRERCVGIRPTGARSRAVGVLRIRTSKLTHEGGDHSMKVKTVVIAAVG
jgi:hypothetical protein